LLYRFGFGTVYEKSRMQFGMSLVQFSMKKKRGFGSDITAVYLLLT